MDKKFDIIIYGATGFTGSLGAVYMDKYSNELNWAIAGRDLIKLKELQDSIPSKPDIIIASYHGIQKKYFDKGDPYQCYCQKTTRLIKEKFSTFDIQTTFQSRLDHKNG